MASQKVRNILNNQIDAIIVRAKAEVKNEGKKKLNELINQFSTKKYDSEEIL